MRDKNLLTILFDSVKDTQYSMSVLYVMLYKTNHSKNYTSNTKFSRNVKNDYVLKHIIHKLLGRYENKNVQLIIKKLIDSQIHDAITDVLDKIDNLLTTITEMIDFTDSNKECSLKKYQNGLAEYHNEFVDQTIKILTLRKMIEALSDKLGDLGVYLMDVYCLRRILDKSYITNVIAYTGGQHSCNYILSLVKYFGFKITNYSYLKSDSIEKATEIIKKSTHELQLTELFGPPVLKQCSDLSSFPKLFS